MTPGDPVTVADDLVERLRAGMFAPSVGPMEDLTTNDAADRIESLTRDLAEARSKALREAASVASERAHKSKRALDKVGFFNVSGQLEQARFNEAVQISKAIRFLIDNKDITS